MDQDRVSGTERQPQIYAERHSLGAAVGESDHEIATRIGTVEPCSICLEPISERAVASPCNHLTFDFLCLVSWLQEQPRCPLCKTNVTSVQYDWRSPHDFKTYRVAQNQLHASQSTQPSSSRQASSRQQRRRESPSRLSHAPDLTLERRRIVYRNRLYSLHIGANPVSRYRDFTRQELSNSPELQSRAKTFLRRELQVFTYLDSLTRLGNREYFVQYILAVLQRHELKGADGRAEELVQRFLGRDNARQILHEFEAWLRSPFTSLAEWDRHAQYSTSSELRK